MKCRWWLADDKKFASRLLFGPRCPTQGRRQRPSDDTAEVLSAHAAIKVTTSYHKQRADWTRQ